MIFAHNIVRNALSSENCEMMRVCGYITAVDLSTSSVHHYELLLLFKRNSEDELSGSICGYVAPK